MNAKDISKIETALGVSLPQSYKSAMCPFLWPAYEGTTDASLWDDANAIVEETLAQRKGFGGAPPWPKNLIVIGDENDACPYALDCDTGRVIYTDHNRLEEEPLDEFSDLSKLIEQVRDTWEKALEKPWWKFW